MEGAGAARVTAADRLTLAPPALGHASLEMAIGERVRYRPPALVDQLICDAHRALRTIDLVDRWMKDGLVDGSSPR